VIELESLAPVEDVTRLRELAEAGLLGVGSDAFRMTIVAETSGPAGRIEASCVMDRQGGIKLWSER
jgi:hypothetical protein